MPLPPPPPPPRRRLPWRRHGRFWCSSRRSAWPRVSSPWRWPSVNGALGGVVSAFGCLLGGLLGDRLDRKLAYCLYGALQVLLVVAMSLVPRTEPWFVVFALADALAVGMAYAAFTAVVLEAIGQGAAATKYNLLASLSNMPLAYVTYGDGWVHSHYGAAAMLQAEGLLGVAGLLVFGALVAARRRGAMAGAGQAATR